MLTKEREAELREMDSVRCHLPTQELLAGLDAENARLRAERDSFKEACGWTPVDRKDLPQSHEKMSYSRGYMLELYEMTKQERDRYREALEACDCEVEMEKREQMLLEMSRKLGW